MQATYIVVRGRDGGTEFLTARGTWARDRSEAHEFITWRKAHNAAKKHKGLTSPAHVYLREG